MVSEPELVGGLAREPETAGSAAERQREPGWCL